jgi:hypothetical protein
MLHWCPQLLQKVLWLPIARERVGKRVSVERDSWKRTRYVTRFSGYGVRVINQHFRGYGNERCFSVGPTRRYIIGNPDRMQSIPCGGGVQYFHHSPASRRRRRKGKSRIWDSKIWSRAQRDLVPRMTALARATSNFKRHTRPLVRESAPQKQTRNCLTVIIIWS